jgi:peptidoglycan-associated lipoprotein
MKIVKLIGIISFSLLFQACSSVEETTEVVDEVVSTAEQSVVTTQAIAQRNSITVTADGALVLIGTEEEGSALSQQTILFDFDVAQIGSDFYASLEAHGSYLANNPGASIRLEGHADERGTREYNIGLGEQRAQSVRQFLMLQGAFTSQITTISFGEERPLSTASNEAAYAQNRRVELVYNSVN